MLYFKVLYISIVINVEELLNLMDTLFCKIDNLILFINYKVAIFFYLFLHHNLHLCTFTMVSTLYKLSCKYITQFI